jgi:hypothetical protein
MHQWLLKLLKCKLTVAHEVIQLLPVYAQHEGLHTLCGPLFAYVCIEIFFPRRLSCDWIEPTRLYQFIPKNGYLEHFTVIKSVYK